MMDYTFASDSLFNSFIIGNTLQLSYFHERNPVSNLEGKKKRRERGVDFEFVVLGGKEKR